MSVKTREEKKNLAIAEPTPELSSTVFAASWLLLALLLLLYYWPTLSGRANFFISDSSYFFEPLCRFVGRQLKEGQLPLWNPLLYCGMSQAAVPSPSIFYLPSYFVFLLPYSQGLSLYMIFHHLLMAVGTYLYLRQLKMERASSLFAAMSGGLMSYFFALSRNFTLPAVVAWLPLSLYLQGQIDAERGKKQVMWRLCFALSVSMFIYAGRPELFVACLGIVALNGLYLIRRNYSAACAKADCSDAELQDSGSTKARSSKEKISQERSQKTKDSSADDSQKAAQDSGKAKYEEQAISEVNLKAKDAKRQILRYALALYIPLIAAIFVAAPVILPALEWSAISPRAHGQKLTDVFSWSAGAYDFASLLLSFPAGDICDLGWNGSITRALFTGDHSSLPFLVSCYLSPIVLLLAAWVAFNKTWKFRTIFLFLLAGSMIICAGQYTPVLPLLVKVFPSLSVLRYPVKLLIFPAMLLIFAAAVGFDFLLKRKISEKFVKLSFCFFAFCAVLAIAVYLLPSFALIGSAYMSQELYAKTVRSINLEVAKSLLHCSIIAMSFCALSFLYLRKKFSFNSFVATVIGGLSLSLYSSAASYPFTVQMDFYNAPSTLFTHVNRFVSENTAANCKWRILPFYTMSGMCVPAGYLKGANPGATARFHSYARSMGYFNTAIDFGIPQSFGYEAAATGDYWELYNEALQYSTQFLTGQHPKEISDLPIYRFCKFNGTKYLLTQEILLSDDSPLPLMDDRIFELFGHSTSNNSRIYRTSPLPRIYIANEICPINDWSEFKSKMLNPAPIDQDSSTSLPVYLLKSDLQKMKIETDPGTGDNSSCSLISENANEMRLSAKASKAAVLVVSDQFYPGWVAYIDAKPVPILRANLFARAVQMPSGEHKIVMRYEPQSVSSGLITAGVAIIVLLLLSIFI